MNLCSDDHTEICFEGRECPACELKGQLNNAEEEIGRLKAQIEELEKE